MTYKKLIKKAIIERRFLKKKQPISIVKHNRPILQDEQE